MVEIAIFCPEKTEKTEIKHLPDGITKVKPFSLPSNTTTRKKSNYYDLGVKGFLL